ncbi:hypothetical protein QE152_g4213 [Popillia japonica]|uniref:Uncharacterized protein n=1 Tax=Popillia japonica TaxID=7064 RepID=A0AAW1N1K7_POPJA
MQSRSCPETIWRENPDKCKSRHCHSANDKPRFVAGDCIQISQRIHNYLINVLGSVVKGGVFLAITLFELIKPVMQNNTEELLKTITQCDGSIARKRRGTLETKREKAKRARCGPQNKNTTMVGMLNYWLQYEAPLNVELVEMVFPVVGHFYILPDRVFGQIRRYKKVPEVVHPEEYIDIIKEFAKVYQIGNDVVVGDWRSEAQKYEAPLNVELVEMVFPVVGHFYILPDRVFGQIRRYKKVPEVVHPEEYIDIIKEFAKVYQIGNDVVVGDWRSEAQKMSPQLLQHGAPMKNDMKGGITKLLEKHYGKEWQKKDSLGFFKEAFQTVVQRQQDREEKSNCKEKVFDCGT